MSGYPEERAPAPQHLFLGRYRIERTLGLGERAVAYDTLLHRMVAIKRMRPVAIFPTAEQYRALEERFVREAEAAARIGSHAHIVTVYDLVRDGRGAPSLICEYAAGGTLAALCAHGRVPLDDAARWAADAARGLAAAHHHGIIHCDITPAHIFIADDGRALVGDFERAQMDGRPGGLGTPLYRSPEQARRMAPLPPQTDQYNLGLVLFEMVTGERYGAPGERGVSALLADAPAAVAAVIRRLTAPDPAGRFPAMPDVARVLDALDLSVVDATARAQGELPPAPHEEPAKLPHYQLWQDTTDNIIEEVFENVDEAQQTLRWYQEHAPAHTFGLIAVAEAEEEDAVYPPKDAAKYEDDPPLLGHLVSGA